MRWLVLGLLALVALAPGARSVYARSIICDAPLERARAECGPIILAQSGTYATTPYRPNNVRITGGTISGVTISGITLAPSDSLFTLEDNADATKKLQFELSGISTGTTRTLTAPNASGTIARTQDKLSAFAATTSAEFASVISDETGTGALVLATSPTLTTPSLGVATATSINGTVIPSSKTLVVTTDTLAALANTTSAQLAGVLTDETGSGSAVFATSPTLVTPNLGTPTAATLSNATGLPISSGVSGLGTGIAAALAVNTGSAGAPVLFNGALGTPSSGTLSNATGLPIATGVSGLAANVATFLATPSSGNLASAVTDEAGTGSLAFASQGSWTPTDVSGASLSFSSADGYYYRVGDLMVASGAVTFPVTGSGAAVQIGSLPCTARNVTANRGGSVTYTDLGSAISARTLENTATIFLYDTAGVIKTNASMSGKVINFSASYVCA